MGFIKFIFSRYFLINLLIAGALLFAIIRFTMYSLNAYTHHGESTTVPDVKGLTLEGLSDMLKLQQLDYFVIDSAYLPDKPDGVILEQDPEPGQRVKEGRKIYITVSRKIPPPVPMPNLIDLKLEIAKEKLQKAGLKLGGIQYYPGLGKNLVLRQLHDDKEIAAGVKIPKGSKIELILADGIGETQVDAPNLIGRTYKEAKWTLTMLKLNLGYVEWDKSITDSSTAVIYKQVPEFDPYDPHQLNFGETVDIYLTQTLPEFLKRYSADSDDHDEE